MTKNYTENLFVGLCASDKNGGPTQMASQLADSLERKGRFDIDDIGKRYLNWHKRDGYDAGPTASRVFQLVSKGISFTKASEQVDYELAGRTAGCNPAHRATPLAMLDVSDKELIDITIQEAKLTHLAPHWRQMCLWLRCCCVVSYGKARVGMRLSQVLEKAEWLKLKEP
jgi:ADP-ribosylglycohydrolase